jgi:hypothetical protein
MSLFHSTIAPPLDSFYGGHLFSHFPDTPTSMPRVTSHLSPDVAVLAPPSLRFLLIHRHLTLLLTIILAIHVLWHILPVCHLPFIYPLVSFFMLGLSPSWPLWSFSDVIGPSSHQETPTQPLMQILMAEEITTL